MKSIFKPDSPTSNKQKQTQPEGTIKENDKDTNLRESSKKKIGLSTFGQKSKLQEEPTTKEKGDKEQKPKKEVQQKIQLEDLRFLLTKDNQLVSSLGVLLKKYIAAQRQYINNEMKNLEFCRSEIIPNENIESTKFTFERFCDASEYSLKQFREYVQFLESSAIPSVNFLIDQIKIIEFLINDFEQKLKELFMMNSNIAKISSNEGKSNEVLKLRDVQERLITNSEYSGTKLKNKLQIYIKDRNDEMRELVLHLNKCKVNYHGQSLTFFSTFFFEILKYDHKEDFSKLDKKEFQKQLQKDLIKTPTKLYKKECKKLLQEYLQEKNVQRYIPQSDGEDEIIHAKVEQQTKQEVDNSDDEHSPNPKFDDDQDQKDSIKETDNDNVDPIIEKMDLDAYGDKTRQAPRVKSFIRISKTQI